MNNNVSHQSINHTQIATIQKAGINLYHYQINLYGWQKNLQQLTARGRKKSDIMWLTLSLIFLLFLIRCIVNIQRLSSVLGNSTKLKLTHIRSFSQSTDLWGIWEYGMVLMSPLMKRFTENSSKSLEIIELRRNWFC